MNERRQTRSHNPWTALTHFASKRAEVAVLADDQGLPLIGVGASPEIVDLIAAETLRLDSPRFRTGSGLDVRLHAEKFDAEFLDGVARILAAA